MGKKNLSWAAAVIATLTLFACVTINIYFPAEKVESAAEEIVNEIRGNEPPPQEKPPPPSSSRTRFAYKMWLVFSPAQAWAAEETTVSNPTIRSLKERMKARYQALTPYYQRGVLREGDDGYLSAVNSGGLNLKEKRDLNGLVDAENSDRRTLYTEVAKALKIDPGQIDRIAGIFAKEWQKPAR